MTRSAGRKRKSENPFGARASPAAPCCTAGAKSRRARGPLCWAAALLLGVALPLSAASPLQSAPTPLRVIYPRSESDSDTRVSYPTAVLRLALERGGREFQLQPSATTMQQERALRMLADGSQLDVAWSMTTAAREAQLRPIRFPIDFGLIGWRVLLVRRGDGGRFAAFDSPASLAGLVAGQGHDWPDLAVLRENGLKVTAATTYEGLFAMLALGRIDYFPRALSEVRAELDEHANLPIELEPALLLHYPSALYFFVNPRNDELAATLERGLERALGDGSLQALFAQTYAHDIAAARLPERRVLELANPGLPAATPLARREWWIDPREMR